MNSKVIVGLRTIPMLLVMATLYFLSDQPGDTLYLPAVVGIDKLVHAVAYGVLAATIIFALGAEHKERFPGVVIFTTLVCFFYGITDEFHQSFVPGRMPSSADVLADACGALLVSLLWVAWQSKRRSRSGGRHGLLSPIHNQRASGGGL